MAMVLISHDLGVVAGLAERIIVMYAGRVVESGTTADILQRAAHPYTAALLKCIPDLRRRGSIACPACRAQPPSPSSEERGCAFAPRCPRADQRCRTERPLLREAGAEGHRVACHHPSSAP